jgi:hypothetical protein
MTSSLKLSQCLPFVVDACQMSLGLYEKQIQVSGSHDWNFPFHFGAEYDVLNEVKHTINSGLEIINVSGFGLVENGQRLVEAEVERLSS